MRSTGWQFAGLVALGSLAFGPSAYALPKEGDPIDPAKRARISTAAAVRPAATPVKGNGVVGGRVIRMNEIPVRPSAVNGDRAPIDVRETRRKDRVTKPSARAITARKVEVRRPSDRPAAIPRIDPERFQHMLREYEKNRVPATEMLNGEVRVGSETVDLGEINRFVNPRAALEAQGIPVRSAGSSEKPASDSAPVPVAREQNGGGAPAAGR